MARRDRRTVADRERDAKCLEMARRGLTMRQISAENGWASPQSASNAIKRAIGDLAAIDNPGEIVQQMRDRLNDYRQRAYRVLLTKHYVTTASGKVAMTDDGQPVLDDAPVLAALDRLLRFDMEERKMLGLDAPVKHHVNVITESDVDQAIRELTEAIAKADAEGIDLPGLLERSDAEAAP